MFSNYNIFCTINLHFGEVSDILDNLHENIVLEGLKQHVTIFDVKVSDKVKDQQYKCGAVANLHSLSSTTVKAGDLPRDPKLVKVSMFVY